MYSNRTFRIEEVQPKQNPCMALLGLHSCMCIRAVISVRKYLLIHCGC